MCLQDELQIRPCSHASSAAVKGNFSVPNLKERWLEGLVNLPSSDTVIAHSVAFRVDGYMTKESPPHLNFAGHVGRAGEIDVGPYDHLQHSMKHDVQPHRQ
jgi:hypothetical protein